MNPLCIAEPLPHRLLQLLTTTFAPRQERLKQDFRIALEREGFLTREPSVSLALPYQGVSALAAGDAGNSSAPSDDSAFAGVNALAPRWHASTLWRLSVGSRRTN